MSKLLCLHFKFFSIKMNLSFNSTVHKLVDISSYLWHTAYCFEMWIQYGMVKLSYVTCTLPLVTVRILKLVC